MKTLRPARIQLRNLSNQDRAGVLSMPSLLVDCRSTNVEHSELFIVEGDHAGYWRRLARSSSYQAPLPIRGKILEHSACFGD